MAQQPLINNGYYNNQVNEYPSQQEINTTPYSDNNNNNPPPPNEYLAQPINTQNNYPAPPNRGNAYPSEVLQYPNSSDFPQYNNNAIGNKTNQPQIDYSKYNNITQLHHRGIKQVDANTFYISKRCCQKIFPIFYFLFSVCFTTVIFWTEVKVGTIVCTVLGGIFTILGILMLCKAYYGYYFQINPNNIRVTEIAWCGRKTTIFAAGQITSIDFQVERGRNHRGKTFYSYSISIYQNIPGLPEKNVIFSDGHQTRLFTEEEIGFFNYIMNHHIQTNLTIHNLV